MILAEAPNRLAVTTSTTEPLVRCLGCHRAVVRGWPDAEHWHHAAGHPDCPITADRDGLRVGEGRLRWTGSFEPPQAKAPLLTHDEWAVERLVAAEGSSMHPDVLRADYVGWVSMRGGRWEERSKMRAAVKKVGGRPRGVKGALRFWDVALAGPAWDSGYRVPGTVAEVGEEGDATGALLALHRAGLVTSSRVLDRAWLDLTGSPGAVLCGACGTLTRRVEAKRHVGCD